MSEQKELHFTLAGIDLEEFTTYEDNYLETDEINHDFGLGFDIEPEDRAAFCGFEVQVGWENKLFIKANLVLSFLFDEESWNSLRVGEDLVLNRELMLRFCTIAVGTARGILHERLSRQTSPFANYILPLVNIPDLVHQEAKFPLTKWKRMYP